MYSSIIRPLFFNFDPEKIHYFVFDCLKFMGKIPVIKKIAYNSFGVIDKNLKQKVFGLEFDSPVGLAAGFDKNGILIDELASLGFSFIEIGTVTPKAQVGNPKKRLFRLPKDQALINRMGFNNMGVEKVVENLKKRNSKVIVGGNIGKNTHTAPEQYTKDYLTCFNALHPHVDYFVLNISCPNVGSHAKLTDKDYLLELITTIQKSNRSFETQKPILIKIAPDLNPHQLDEIIELVAQTKLDGVVACNTSISRSNLKTDKKTLDEIGNGGLSGKPVSDKSTEVIRYLHTHSKGAFPIIGVGGIHSAKDAQDKIDAGASLVQLYTGFVYQGPQLIRDIHKTIKINTRYTN